MRRKNVWLVILLLTALGLTAQAEVTTTVGSSADTWIESSTTTHGSDTFMSIRGATVDDAGYVRFDLSSLYIATVVSARVTFTVSGGAPRNDNIVTGRFALYGLNNVVGNTPQNWIEATLSDIGSANPAGAEWNGVVPLILTNGRVTDLDGDVPGITETLVPSGGGSAAGITASVTGAPLVAFIQNRVNDNGLVTFIIGSEDEGSSNGYGLATKENATVAYRPVLEITYIPGGVYGPQPANNSLQTLELSQLCWTTAAGIGKCDVWFGPGEPNSLDYKTKLTKIGTITNPAESQCITIPAGMRPLTNLTTYSWVVDSYKGNPLPSEPNMFGPVWKFTATSLPILTAQPAEQIKFETETAEFTISATSSTPITYTWYRSPDNANNTPGDDVSVGTNSPTLTLTNLARTDEGYYYCKATNTGGSSYSNTANLGVKRKVAHWTLDGLVGGQYADSSGEGHNADPNGTPVFVAGAGTGTNDGVQIDIDNGFASAGTWDPTGHTRQMTISLWAKWTGQTVPASWQGLIAKENVFGAATMMWQLEADLSNNNLALKSGNSTITSTPLPAGTWIHIAVVYDGTTARIYRNGVSSVSGTFVLGTKTDAPVIIGASAKAADTGLYSSLFNGVLDDVRIYSYAMTQNEVIDIYHAVSGQSICINRPTYDYTNDCLVTMADFARLAANWLSCGLYPACP